jgi:hypothetical protein
MTMMAPFSHPRVSTGLTIPGAICRRVVDGRRSPGEARAPVSSDGRQ